MSQENVEIARRLLDAYNRGDRAACVALCDPQLEWVPPADWPENATIHGAEAVWDFVVSLNDPWEKGAYELLGVIDGGHDKVAVHVGRSVRGRVSGVAAEFDYWNVATFHNGKQVRSEWFLDREAALDAMGSAGEIARDV